MLSMFILFYIIKVIDDTDLCPSSKIHLPAELQQLGSAGIGPGLSPSGHLSVLLIAVPVEARIFT